MPVVQHRNSRNAPPASGAAYGPARGEARRTASGRISGRRPRRIPGAVLAIALATAAALALQCRSNCENEAPAAETGDVERACMQRCLQENQMRAVGWEQLKRDCRAECGGDGGSDPFAEDGAEF